MNNSQFTVYRNANGSFKTYCLNSSTNVSQVTSATQITTLLSDDIVNMTVISATPIDFRINDYIYVFDKIYKLNSIPSIVKESSRKFTYQVKFESLQYDLLKCTYLIPQSKGDIDLKGDYLVADLRGFAEVIITNTQRVFGKRWRLGECPTNTEFKNLSFDGQNCLQVLQSLCQEYDTEFEIISSTEYHTINIKEVVGNTYPFTFEYGKTGGLYNLSRNNCSNKSLVTRLFVYGGSKNLSTKYRQTKLCLPNKNKVTSYLEEKEAVNKFGIIENVVNFEDIYPCRTGKVTSLGGKYFQFCDEEMFNLNEKDDQGTLWLIEGTNAKVHFQTGNLAGYEFDVHSYDDKQKMFSLVPFDDDRGLRLPNEESPAFQIMPGDTYVLLNINLPQNYIDDAEQRLLKKGEKYYQQNSQPYVEYSLVIDPLFLKKREGEGSITNFFQAGDLIKIKDEDINVNKSIRVNSFSRDLINPYKYELTISDTVETNIITNILENVIKNDTIIKVNNLKDPARIRRNWRDTEELKGLIFDPEGNYFTEKIKPGSIDTMMLSVGAKSMQFDLINTLLEANYQGDYNVIKVTGGSLVHYAIEQDIKYWNLGSGTTNLSNTNAYYIYARCEKKGGNGTLIFSQDQIKVDDDSSYFHFIIGVLNSVQDNVRSISLTYGSTTINGKFIRTGKITSSDGSSFLDLDNNHLKFGDDNACIEWNRNNDRKLVIKGTIVQSPSGDENVIGVYRGEYDNSKKYYVGDEVTYLGSSYRMIKEANPGNTPTNRSYWTIISKSGKDGYNGKDGTNGKDGANGRNGTDGKDGLNGVDGKDGKDGKDGIDGKDGYNGPALVFRGEYKDHTVYRGTRQTVEVVKFRDMYYISNIDAGEFVDIWPLATHKWTPFGANFESVATDTLLAENANIGDWIIQNGKITSQNKTSQGTPKAQLNGVNGGINFKNDSQIYTEQNTTENTINEINISSEFGEIMIANAKGHKTTVGSQGIEINRAGKTVYKTNYGAEFKAALIVKGDASMDQKYWNQWGICGLFASAQNYSNNPAPSWGAYIRVLKAMGLYLSTQVLNGGITLNETSCFTFSTNKDDRIYLPNKPQEGQLLIFRAISSCSILGNGNQILTLNKGLQDGIALLYASSAILIFMHDKWIQII